MLVAVYVGLIVVGFVSVPLPLCVHIIPPLLAVAVVTVSLAFEHIVALPITDVTGSASTFTVYWAVVVCGAHEFVLVTVIVKITLLPPSANAAV